jgi:hypothetical protein
VRSNGAVGGDAGAYSVRVQREGEPQAVGEGRGGNVDGVSDGGVPAQPEEGGAGLGVGLEGPRVGRERRTVGQSALERFEEGG